MRLLAIDTATEACSVALVEKNGSIIERYQLAVGRHSELVLPMISDLLTQSDCSRSDLSAIAFDSGPGSFTGIRIGLGIAQGLSIGLNIRLIGIPSLMILAEGSVADEVFPAIDARMGQVYWARLSRDSSCIEGWRWIDEITVTDPSLMPKLSTREIGFGSGWDRYHETLQGSRLLPNVRLGMFPRAAWLGAIAERILESRSDQELMFSGPTYVRASVAEEKL